jgi:probable F420-dependent oxidoreductase
MRIGLFLVPLTAQVESLRALGERADRLEAIHSVWIPEPHLLAFSEPSSDYLYTDDGKMPEEYSAEGELDGMLALAFLAAVTSRVRLGIGVCILPQREPLSVAKAVTTLDHLSDGRFDFGVGIGWMSEEFRAVGASFEDRAARTADHIGVLETLWSEEPIEAGPLAGAKQEPYPLQDPHPPMYFGGNSRRALERVAQFGQGWLPWDLGPEEAGAGIADLEGLLGQRDRERAEIDVSVATTRSIEELDAAAYAAAGVDQLLVVVPPLRSREEVDELFDRLDTPALAAR